MDESRHEKALADAFGHIASQPRPVSDEATIASILARTGHPHRRSASPSMRWLAAAAALVVAAGLVWTLSRLAPMSAPVVGTPMLHPLPTATSRSTPASATPTAGRGASDAVAASRCEPLGAALLTDAERAGNVGGTVRFVSGQMVKTTQGWWLLAVKAQVDDPEYARVNGIDKDGLMAFATDAPGGGSHWIPLSDQAQWDGTTATGARITDWVAYRERALDCVRRR